MIKKISLFIFISLFVPIFAFAENQFPSFPMAFWGTATIDGQSLPSGTKIQSFCSDSLIGEVTMSENGIYGYADSTKIKLLVSNCSSDILFKYLLSGSTISLTGASEITNSFRAGTTEPKDLNFVTTQSCNSGYHLSGNTCVADSTGGGGPSGGGNPPITPTVTPTTTKAGDANGDNKVDKYDFSLMMSNWGKAGINVCDFNKDGKVDKYDFALLMSKWGL